MTAQLPMHKPLERLPSSPKVVAKHTVNFPTKKLRMRSLLWVKPSGDAVSSTSSFLAQLFPTVVVNLAALSVGFGYGFSSIVIAQLKDGFNGSQTFDVKVDDSVASWIAAMFGLGAAVGGFCSALLGSSIGRRRCILLMTIPDIIGWILLASSVNLYMVLVGRFLTGFAVAGYLPSILIYVAEISQPQHRGILSAVTIPSIALGTLLSYCLGYFIPWNYAAIVGIAMPVVLIPGLLMISNSPQWYLQQGQEKQAVQAMEKFRSSDANGLSELLAIADILKAEHYQVEDLSIMSRIRRSLEALAQRRNRRPLLILNTLFLLMLFSGEFSIGFYAVDIFKRSASLGDCFLSAIIVASIKFAGSLVFLVAIKYCTRKLLLTSTSVIMGVSLAVLGFAMYIHDGHLLAEDLPSWVALLCVTIYMAVAPIGLGSLPYIYIGEFFSTEHRSLLAGFTIGLAQLEMFAVVKTFPALSTTMGNGGIFWMYSGVCFVAAVFSAVYVPETKGKGLEEIEAVFGHKRNLHVTPYATPIPQRRHNGRPNSMQSIQFTL